MRNFQADSFEPITINGVLQGWNTPSKNVFPHMSLFSHGAIQSSPPPIFTNFFSIYDSLQRYHIKYPSYQLYKFSAHVLLTLSPPCFGIFFSINLFFNSLENKVSYMNPLFIFSSFKIIWNRLNYI